jgi:hypothetical protein
MGRTLRHVFVPRLLDPDKPPVINNSDLVRTYSGVWVAGTEMGTSVAFGYAAESYVDYGLPWMFAPVFLFGWAFSHVMRWLHLLIRHRGLSDAVVAALVLGVLYQFEQSWVRLLSALILGAIALGGAAALWARAAGARS